MGNFPLVGMDRDSYADHHGGDLVAIRARPLPNALSRWLTHDLIPGWNKLIGEKFKVNPIISSLFTLIGKLKSWECRRVEVKEDKSVWRGNVMMFGYLF